MTPRTPITGEEVADVLERALGEYDAVVRACPANKTFLGEKLCPKCKAGPNEGCREEIRAAFTFIQEARQAATAARQQGEGK